MNDKKPILLIAFGGNALIKKGQTGTADQQFENLSLPMKQIAELSRKYRLVITHGNGPQVGNLLLQQESCDEVPKMPLEVIGAMTQGQIGYMIESSLDTALMEMGVDEEQDFVSLITYVVVDENDPAFQNPTKPIGPFYTEAEAAKLSYNLVKTDKGYRRVVASPKPVAIVERKEIKKLIDMDFIVICCGGGGIPVVRKERRFSGVEAVIDKDLASSVLAREINADIFIVASDVEGAAVDWGKPEQRILRKVALSEIKEYVEAGHFPEGSMGPKVDAVIQFAESTGNRSIICNLDDIQKSVEGIAGTEICQ
ncbi:MAG: carbamate kinase [Deltaproteobacteria bacterium]|nr:carbamate kinase [Deltaproteobacteria bacterium]MBW2228426.1 carbamate kinase [Deltaproteobacteria bacterium]MBW2327103.1 carbamate kinase [Deltaproteobacteria bacterium]